MPRGYKSIKGGLELRVTMQKEIIEKFGEEAITKARERLCSKCKEQSCFLLPICIDGKDCPYFKLKEEKK